MKMGIQWKLSALSVNNDLVRASVIQEYKISISPSSPQPGPK